MDNKTFDLAVNVGDSAIRMVLRPDCYFRDKNLRTHHSGPTRIGWTDKSQTVCRVDWGKAERPEIFVDTETAERLQFAGIARRLEADEIVPTSGRSDEAEIPRAQMR